MINRLVLLNFQIHKTLDLEFTDGLNCILGHNNGGKSSIIRALHWLLYNSPSGDWMRRIDSEGVMCTTKVKLFLKDGIIIQRIKGEDGLNQYKLDDETFDNFGFQVPQKIKNALKIIPFETNKLQFNINVSMQEDKPFLVNESAPVKASVIDKLTGTSVLQKAISGFNKESLSKTKTINELTYQIENDKDSLKGMPDIDTAQNLVNEISILESKAKEFKAEIKSLKTIQENHKFFSNKIKSIIIPEIIKVDSLKEQWRTEEKILQNCLTESNIIQANKIYMTDIPEIDVSESIKKYNELCGECEELDGSLANHNDNLEIIKSIDLQLKEDESWIKEYYIENPTCPTCKGKWGQ